MSVFIHQDKALPMESLVLLRKTLREILSVLAVCVEKDGNIICASSNCGIGATAGKMASEQGLFDDNTGRRNYQ